MRAIIEPFISKLMQVFKIDNIILVEVGRYVAAGIEPVLCESCKVIEPDETLWLVAHDSWLVFRKKAEDGGQRTGQDSELAN